MKPRKSITELRAIVLQRRLRLACQAGRIMAGHEPGIVRGPLLPLRKLGEPVTLEQIKVQAVRSAIDRHAGNKTAAAAELGIERQTVYSILGNNGERKRYPLRNVIQLATAAACLVVLVGCSVSESHKKNQAGVRYSDISGAESGLQSHKSLPPLPGEVSSFKFQESIAAPVRQRWLVWDGNANEYLVETGPQRGTITNSFRVATNAVLFKSGIHYRISAIGPDGLVGGAYWPSNRIAELRLKDANGGNALLLRYTNSPPGVSRFWTVTNNPSAYIADVTAGWQ